MASLQRVLLVIFSGGLWCAAQAQDSSAPIPSVEIAGPGSLALRRNATVAKIIVARGDIIQYGDSNLADVLKRQPGISVTDGAVRMRGLGAGYTQILINGDPAPQGFSIGSISPEMIERIEILRSASAEQSTQAVAGSINLVLRKVVATGQREAKAGTAFERGRAGPTASLQVGERAGALSYSIGATFTRKVFEFTGRTEEDVRTADGAPTALRRFERYNSGHDDQLDLSPRLNWALDNGDTVSWQNLIGISRADSGSGEPETTLFGAPTSYPDNSAVFLSRFASLRSDAGWTHRIGADGKLTVKAVVGASRRRSAYAFDGIDPDGVPALHRAVDSGVDEDSVGLSGKLSMPLGAGHGLGIGWDGGLITRGEARLQADSRMSGPAAVVLDQAYTARVQRMALFAQDEWEMSPQLQGYFGLRWEGVRSATDGKDFARVGNRYSVFSPSAQLLWKLPARPRDQLRLALARTYKAPLTRDLVPRRYTMNNDNSAANPDQEGNPALRPELSWGLDLAYEMYFRADGVASVSGFARKIQDVTVQRLYRDGAAWVSRPENAGAAETHGIEFDVKMPLRWWLAAAASGSTPPLELHANLTRAWSHLDAVAGPYNRLADQTPLTANLGLDYRPGGRWSFGVNASYQGAATTRSAAPLSSYQSSQCLFDVYTVWQLDKRTKLRVTGANLLQRERRSIQLYADADGSIRRTGIADGSAIARVVLEQGF
jgi:outer membrane receptor for ferrienterochelin and colicins